MAELAVDSFNVDEVWIFGSLATKKMRKNSDIDIMVSGLPMEKYWSFFKKAEELAYPFKIDIVLREKASSALKKRVKREGVKLTGEEKNNQLFSG
ncbi:nucleotidyltransferase family protein [Halarsenatibacter silvermanii]|uniref:nucleotidyltransferase family protein n=1 Tax=Halarsenatibacter silvermanii TaxID=321763 RepID=UPI00135645FB|nr:nucleotidyltransferase domain-containing protein [Halarsenatibacter silvermanii]